LTPEEEGNLPPVRAKREPIERGKPLSTYLSPSAKRAFAEDVQASGLTASAYLRAVITGGTVRATPVNLTAVRTLAKVNADQARLGNLLKLYLQDSKPEHAAAAELIAEIREMQRQLKAVIREIRT
jgi:hypothetical protein